ncbi:GNAT family N-acetyltransferase [Candidatus Synechococcus calcipolaris G9]|uniref:GNAT family N-acetyltransferase n=1 Tax=Candidatus Synechococcus calcipolaris G9 TaxID=1497997 RepID=A0ABT6EZ44_9SYNE|nr:GNAT family N-acetyltransferase [Candidatus Synechococcus calcipolaris]MDG2990783.1 GNAT family N-acetyltransferase [Candidatus Synechococcus calcipolaris G9]
MTDMLVKLYNLEVDWPKIAAHNQQGIIYRQPLGSETHLILDWVKGRFSQGWVSEVSIALHQRPPRCVLAVEAGKLQGFACYDTAALGLFGPMGVDEAVRGQGIGTLLLQLTLWQMKEQGYAYAIIGWVGPTAFYERTVGAIAIPDSEPGLWASRLQAD